MCRNNQCDCISVLERTLTYHRKPREIRLARLWEEITTSKTMTREQYEQYIKNQRRVENK